MPDALHAGMASNEEKENTAMSSGGRIAAVVALVAMVTAACAKIEKPVLYPNGHLQQVGKHQADEDVEICRQLASEYVPGGSAAKDIAKGTGIGGLGGAAVGAVAGAVSGGGAGAGAAIGAATGATAGAVHGAAKQTGPSPVYKNFVDRCLQERGYEVIGWQ